MQFFKRISLLLLLLAMSSLASFKIGEISQNRGTNEGLVEIHGEAFISMVNLNLTRSSIIAGLNKNDTLILPVTEQKNVKLVKSKIRTTSTGGIYWRGIVIGDNEGYGDIFIRNNLVSGSIYLNGVVFKLDAISTKSIRIVTLDPDARPEDPHECGIDDEIHKDEVEKIGPQIKKNNRAVVMVDLLILYPQQIENQMGGASGMENEILFRIEEANEAFENSLMDTRFRLAHHQVVSSSDIPSNATSASQVSASSLAKSLRKQYKADLVSHWNYGGSAGSGNNYSGSYSAAYNTSNFSDVQSRYTFVHECGHNMGAKHDRYTYIEQGRENELEDYYYKYGYLIDYGSGSARTIMAYNQCGDVGISGSCTRVPYFSNPNVTYKSAVTGINPPSSSAAYNARRIDECAPTVSNFEDGDPVVTYSLTVNNGFGDGEYETGASVTITANDAPLGKVFDKWIGDISSISNVNSPTTTITIGTSNLTVSATYIDEVGPDTINASPNLLEIAGWEADHDSYGNSSVDTGNAIIINDVVKADFEIGASNSTDDIWPYGSVTAYLDTATDLTAMNYIKITYKSDKPINVSLPQAPIADSGASYMMEIPASSSYDTVLLKVSQFAQPDWVGASLKTDLNLSIIKAISFEASADGAAQSIEISEVILYGYDLPVGKISEELNDYSKLFINSVNSKYVHIEVPFSGTYDLSVYSIDGKLIQKIKTGNLEKGLNKITWKEPALASKLYLVSVEGMGMKAVRKTILNKEIN